MVSVLQNNTCKSDHYHHDYGVKVGEQGCLTLPEGEEDDAFDGEELDERIKGLQELLGGVVEEKQSIQSKRHRDVVNNGDIQVAAVDAAQN